MNSHDENEQSFIGGLRWSGTSGVGNATWPLARLVTSATGMTVGPQSAAAAVPTLGTMPSMNLSWADVACAERVVGAIARSPGVRFRFRDKQAPIIFWTFRPVAVLDAVEAHGIQVDRTKQRVSLMGT